jgi:hypothetical protein
MVDDFFKNQEAQLQQQKAIRAEVEQQGKVSSSRTDIAKANKAWRQAQDAQAAAASKNPILGRIARSATVGLSVSLAAIFRVIPGGRSTSNVLFGVAGATALRSHQKSRAAAPTIRQAHADTNDAVRANAAANHSRVEANAAMNEAATARRKANNAMALSRSLARK